MAIQSTVARKDTEGRAWGPRQRIPVGQALRVCTMNGAWCSFEEKAKGSITDGKLGDFVILEKDPHDVDPDHITEIRVLRTVMDGKTTHES
jgi:predicted amidohydrolase YtcJ